MQQKSVTYLTSRVAPPNTARHVALHCQGTSKCHPDTYQEISFSHGTTYILSLTAV